VSDTDLGGLFPALPQPAQTPIPPDAGPAVPYRVLARKYRPSTFAELIGQDALVRTLTNAFAQNRIAHAFMLTGVRGVGKTTTARIVARALNCIGPDGTGGPTITPCGVCDNCVAIAADRHVDVLEMDAASNNGIEDIRELIDGVRYAPGAARYKVYIVDEVHMLSKAAFNALLKTLEEPPPHVKFIFATTEIRKVPITVLSRCQRFDLRRIDADILIAHFNRIAAWESVQVEPAAMAMIARAADGSARDGLSLLDQAIARGAGAVTAEQVRDMLGLADRAIVFDLYEAALGGDARAALDILGRLHAAGADAGTIIEDLLDLTHGLTRLRLAPGAAGTRSGDPEFQRGVTLAGRLGMPVLTRAWQLLLKGMDEVRTAPNPHAAAEMIVLRLAFAADLPSPADLVRRLESGAPISEPPRPAPSLAASPQAARSSMARPERGGGPGGAPQGVALARAQPMAESDAEPEWQAHKANDRPVPAPSASARLAAPNLAAPNLAAGDTPATNLASPANFRELVRLFAEKKEGVLEYHLSSSVRLVRFEPGLIEIAPEPAAPANLANRVGSLLTAWTGRRWVVGISGAVGQETLAEADRALADASLASARANPVVLALMAAFPGATITEVRDLAERTPEAEDAPGLPDGESHYQGDSAEPTLDNGDEP
jgi:DNA polymerase-3 subunit gamma/tau